MARFPLDAPEGIEQGRIAGHLAHGSADPGNMHLRASRGGVVARARPQDDGPSGHRGPRGARQDP